MGISKDQYILGNLSKTKHKKWEQFIITRIYYALNDPDIEFVCQQLVKTKNGKRYFADLCFPGLKLYYEIDEPQHSSQQHITSDQSRKKEIIDATGFYEKRIRVYDQNNNDRKLNEIEKEVDKFVEFIRQRKEELLSKGEFTPWDYKNKYTPDIHRDRGYIDIKDNVVFLTHHDALRCFGYKKGLYRKAVWKIPDSNKAVWFPKLYPNDTWENSLSDDFKKIIMKNKVGLTLSDPEEKEWIVFAHNRDSIGQIVYKFLGEFHLSLEESDNSQYIFNRKKSKIYFDNL